MLGLQRNIGNDIFTYNVGLNEKPTTKRTILSQVARLFVAQGFPVILFAEHIMQRLWSFKVLVWANTTKQSIIQI